MTPRHPTGEDYGPRRLDGIKVSESKVVSTKSLNKVSMTI